MRKSKSALKSRPKRPKQSLRESSRRTRYEALLRMMRKWAEDESGYEERAWPILKRNIEENRLSVRKRFSD